MKLHCYPVSPLRRTAHNCFFIPLEPANTTKTQQSLHCMAAWIKIYLNEQAGNKRQEMTRAEGCEVKRNPQVHTE